MDYNLNIIDTIATNNFYVISKNGSFYVKDKNDKIVKYTDIKSKPKQVKIHHFNGKLFQENMANELKNNGVYALKNYPDSLQYNIYEKIDSISYVNALDEFEKQVMTNLNCVINTSTAILLIYDDEEYILNEQPRTWRDNLGHKKSTYEILYAYNKCKSKNKLIKNFSQNLKLMDKAVTGNGSSGGNHFVPGSFYPKGLQYFEFSTNGELTQFKRHAEHVLAQKIASRNIPGTDIFLLDVKEERYDYINRTTYSATISK